MYTGQPCDFVVICICFCVETPFSFFVFLLLLQKNKTKPTPNPQNQYRSLDPMGTIKAPIPADYFTHRFSHAVSKTSFFLQHTRQFALQQPAGIDLVSTRVHQPFLLHATSVFFSLYLTKEIWK